MVCCHVCFHKTKPEASYVRALRRDCTHSARTLPARTLPLLLFTEVPRRGVLRTSPVRLSRRLAARKGLAPSLVGLSEGGHEPQGISLLNGSLRAPAEGLSTEARERGVLWTSPVTNSPSFACIVFWAHRWIGSSLRFSEVSERAHQRKPEPLAGGPGPKKACLLRVGVELTTKRCAPGRPSAPPSRKLSARPQQPQRSARREDRRLRPARSRWR
jgi:hypothetical protein